LLAAVAEAPPPRLRFAVEVLEEGLEAGSTLIDALARAEAVDVVAEALALEEDVEVGELKTGADHPKPRV
jgi:hypothetical protein